MNKVIDELDDKYLRVKEKDLKRVFQAIDNAAIKADIEIEVPNIDMDECPSPEAEAALVEAANKVATHVGDIDGLDDIMYELRKALARYESEKGE